MTPTTRHTVNSWRVLNNYPPSEDNKNCDNKKLPQLFYELRKFFLHKTAIISNFAKDCTHDESMGRLKQLPLRQKDMNPNTSRSVSKHYFYHLWLKSNE